MFVNSCLCLCAKETSNNLSSQPLTNDDIPVVVDKLINFVTNNGMNMHKPECINYIYGSYGHLKLVHSCLNSRHGTVCIARFFGCQLLRVESG